MMRNSLLIIGFNVVMFGLNGMVLSLIKKIESWVKN